MERERFSLARKNHLSCNREYGDCLVPVILERLPPKVRLQLTRDHGSNDWEITPLLLALQKEIEILEANPTFNEEATPPLSTVNFASAAQRVQPSPAT